MGVFHSACTASAGARSSGMVWILEFCSAMETASCDCQFAICDIHIARGRKTPCSVLDDPKSQPVGFGIRKPGHDLIARAYRLRKHSDKPNIAICRAQRFCLSQECVRHILFGFRWFCWSGKTHLARFASSQCIERSQRKRTPRKIALRERASGKDSFKIFVGPC